MVWYSQTHIFKGEINMGKSGFTLIELLIVVAIIAILAAIATPNFLEAQVRAKTSRVKSDVRSLSTALQAYRVDHNNFPLDGNDYESTRMNEFNSRRNLSRVTTPVAFITSVPNDPFHVNNSSNPSVLGIFTPDPPPYTYLYMTPGGYGEHNGKPDKYGLFSLGPDQDLDAMGSALISYDPTNGTISNGDIIRLN